MGISVVVVELDASFVICLKSPLEIFSSNSLILNSKF
jgi:hypothetical protein